MKKISILVLLISFSVSPALAAGDAAARSARRAELSAKNAADSDAAINDEDPAIRRAYHRGRADAAAESAERARKEADHAQQRADRLQAEGNEARQRARKNLYWMGGGLLVVGLVYFVAQKLGWIGEAKQKDQASPQNQPLKPQ